MSSGSVDGACAVLNEVCGALEQQAARALRRWLRAPPLEPLALGAPSPPDAAPDLALRLNRDLEAQRQLYLVSFHFYHFESLVLKSKRTCNGIHYGYHIEKLIFASTYIDISASINIFYLKQLFF